MYNQCVLIPRGTDQVTSFFLIFIILHTGGTLFQCYMKSMLPSDPRLEVLTPRSGESSGSQTKDTRLLRGLITTWVLGSIPEPCLIQQVRGGA